MKLLRWIRWEFISELCAEVRYYNFQMEWSWPSKNRTNRPRCQCCADWGYYRLLSLWLNHKLCYEVEWKYQCRYLYHKNLLWQCLLYPQPATPSSKLLPCHMLTQTPRVNLASITRSTRLLWALNETNCLIDNKYFMIYDDDCQIPCSRLMLIDKLQQWSELDFCDRIIGAWSSQLDLYNTCYRKHHLVKDILNRFLIDWEANIMSFFIAELVSHHYSC